MAADVPPIDLPVGPAAPAGDTAVELPTVPQQVAHAAGGGLAARLNAGLRKLEQDSTRDFPVPSWGGDLVVRARKLTEDEVDQADTAAKTIALATRAVLLREQPDHPHRELSWREVGDLMGVPTAATTSSIVAAVFANSGMAIRGFQGELLMWMGLRQSQIAAFLGG